MTTLATRQHVLPAPGGRVLARLLDHDGHLTLFQNRIGEVHAWLASHA